MKTLNDICKSIGEGWEVDCCQKNELAAGFHRLKNNKEKNFYIYCCFVGEMIFIRPNIYNELNGVSYTTNINRGAKAIGKSIKLNVLNQKRYLFDIVNNRS
ncbi:TPA: hypothetical protein RG419_003598 [Morganella morganii]|nr:hypothetical protein [Morganella morganii]